MSHSISIYRDTLHLLHSYINNPFVDHSDLFSKSHFDRHVGCLQSFTITDDTVMKNLGCFVFLSVYLWNLLPRIWISESKANLCELLDVDKSL